jgi:hypothetical protein
MDFEVQTEVWTSPKMRIWNLVQEFNSKDFELQTKDNLGLNKGCRIEEIWIWLGIWIQRKVWTFSKNGNYKGDLKSFRNSKIDLAQEWNLNQQIWFKSKNIWIPRQGFDLKTFPNLGRYKPFKIGSGDLVVGFKFKSSVLNQGYSKIQVKDLNFKRRFNLKDLNSTYFIELKGRFWMEILLNFEWTWVNWTWEYFLNNSGIYFKVLKIKSR